PDGLHRRACTGGSRRGRRRREPRLVHRRRNAGSASDRINARSRGHAGRAGMRLIAALLLSLAVVTSPLPSRATDAPFEARLMRLAEILGSLHYLRSLCGEAGGHWRKEMESLLESEKPDPERRARLV